MVPDESSNLASNLFPEESEDTQTAIIKATFEALAKHGYADLTIKNINKEFAKSEGLIFHHYNNKDDILLDLFEYLLKYFKKSEFPIKGVSDPEDKIKVFLDRIIIDKGVMTNDDFEKVFIELRTQAAQDEEYRFYLKKTQNHLQSQISDVIREGIDTGTFREVNPEQVADFLICIMDGVMFDRVTTRKEQFIRDEIDNYIECHLLAERSSQ